MAVLRSWAEVEAFDGGPTEPELKLIDKCLAGQPCILGAGQPNAPTADLTIRAEVLRYLIIGGCAARKVTATGIDLRGAYISGKLNVDFATAQGATRLYQCVFENQICSELTHFKLISIQRCVLPGWFGQGAEVDGSIFLRNTMVTSPIVLSGARIGGQITCEGARFTGVEGTAIELHSASVNGHVMLVNAVIDGTVGLNSATIRGQLACVGARIKPLTPYAITAAETKIVGGVFLHPRRQEDKDKVAGSFVSYGEVQFNGAVVGAMYAQQVKLIASSTGQTLSLGGATINGAVRLDGCDSTGEILLAGSRILGRLTCERVKIRNDKGHAFNGQAMRVDQSFIWKKVEHHAGAISLNGAHVAELDDDPSNWPNSKNLFLDGFTYDRIKGTVSTSPARMDWLKAGSYFGDEFRPQPYSQYAKFLRDTGHDEDARRVLYTRERLRRASTRAQLRTSGNSFAGPLNLWTSFWDILLRVVVGYGHYPFRSVAALAVLICCTIIPAHFAWEEGSFAPNAAPVIVSEEWTTLARTENQPAAVWSGDRLPSETALTLQEWQAIAPGRDWETFNRYAYGFDVVIPIIDFGQTEAWAPSTNRGSWGWHLWWGRWVLSVMGWIVTALGAAAITGIIRRD